MDVSNASNQPTDLAAKATDDDGDLADMLGELRVLLPTARLLSAFLVAVPFAPGFQAIVQAEKNVFLATFMLSVASLVLGGPASSDAALASARGVQAASQPADAVRRRLTVLATEQSWTAWDRHRYSQDG